MPTRNLHLVHLLIRQNLKGGHVGFLVYPHEQWKDAAGNPYLALPAKKTVKDPLAEFIQGTPLDSFVNAIVRDELEVPESDFDLNQEFEAVDHEMESPTQTDEHGQPLRTRYTIYPIDLWIAPGQREPLQERLNGIWLTVNQATADPPAIPSELSLSLSPTAGPVFMALKTRHDDFQQHPPRPEAKRDTLQAEALRQLFSKVPDRPSMDALAKEWLSHNLHGVRHLTRAKLNEILDAGSRAFNLRVADPYLRYQMQGQGFTWSFFTHKDPQDCHVHGAPIVEIYGILEGEMEIWSKPYYERGTAAWSRRVLKPGDWLEVNALQCHIVHWLGKGKGVVFKAGPGPLAEVGKLGVKGKTPCDGCPCMKPEQVKGLEALKT